MKMFEMAIRPVTTFRCAKCGTPVYDGELLCHVCRKNTKETVSEGDSDIKLRGG